MNSEKTSWTVYSNTLPMSDLTDNQAAEVFNWWRNGGDIEKCVFFSKNIATKEVIRGWELDNPDFNLHSTYRAKQKSERELFVEAAKSRFSEECGHSIDQIACIAYMLFDSGKFKLVEETK